LQVELFGCEEYQLDEGLIFFSLSAWTHS
jgi:hypothetical protein